MLIPPEQLMRHVPKNLLVIAFAPLHQNEYTLEQFPLFRQQVQISELPNFTCLVDIRAVRQQQQPQAPAQPNPFQTGPFDLSPTYPGRSSSPPGNPPR
jgi:hypothetical protein